MKFLCPHSHTAVCNGWSDGDQPHGSILQRCDSHFQEKGTVCSCSLFRSLPLWNSLCHAGTNCIFCLNLNQIKKEIKGCSFSLPCCPKEYAFVQVGIYVFQLLDHYTAIVSIMFLAFFEVMAVCWIYGERRVSFIAHLEWCSTFLWQYLNTFYGHV